MSKTDYREVPTDKSAIPFLFSMGITPNIESSNKSKIEDSSESNPKKDGIEFEDSIQSQHISKDGMSTSIAWTSSDPDKCIPVEPFRNTFLAPLRKFV